MAPAALVITFLVVIGHVKTESTTGYSTNELPPPCSSEIFCFGDLLHHVQLSRLYHDSKIFVDKKLKYHPQHILRNFSLLAGAVNSNGEERLAKEHLAVFIEQHFEPEGSEFESWQPVDWTESPKFLHNIDDPELQKWASSLNYAWKFLGRKIKDDVKVNPHLYSMIYVPNPVIVPGGRFREFYYWDSYWIIQGLLLSEMHATVKGMLENFLLMIERYGMIPNGGRIYYENRSQAPLLIAMVEKYYEATGDLQFIRDNVHLLEKELNFWLVNRTLEVNGHLLARYNVESTGPRPESYAVDYEASKDMNDTERTDFYVNMKTGAESGWDFTTRWFLKHSDRIEPNITHIKARHIIPADLNAYICMNCRILSRLFSLLGSSAKAQHYQELFQQWKSSMYHVLWNETSGSWLDFDLLNNQQRHFFYVSNLVPIWAGCWDPVTPGGNVTASKIFDYLMKSEAMNYPGGVPASMQFSGQQWDFPNGWPPLQHMLVFALEATNDPKCGQLAFELMQRWVLNNYEAYLYTLPSAMFEKYDVTVIGLPGGGGEYDVQLGFGWTNGVIMDFLDKYGRSLTSDPLRRRVKDMTNSKLLHPIEAMVSFLSNLIW